MHSTVFDGVLAELREDFTGQPRDGFGRFASTGGQLMSGVEVATPETAGVEAEKPKGGGWKTTANIAGAGLSIAAGVGAGIGASALYDQLKKRPAAPTGESPVTPQPAVPDPPNAPGAATGGTQDERLNQILTQLTKEKTGGNTYPEAPESPEAAKLKEGINDYAKKRSKGTTKPKSREDAFDWILSRLDFEETKHPRDGRGRFAKKGSGRNTLMSAIEGNEGTKPAASTEGKKSGDGLDDLSIRDLKDLARKHQVIGYSNMKKEELAQGIRAAKSNPNQQKRIRETLRRKSEARKIVGSTPAAKLVRDWEKMNKIIRASGASPELAAIALGAFIVNKSVQEWEKQKKEYQQHVGESATDAAARARTIPTEDFSDKPNVVFAVGGYKGLGSTGNAIINEFTNEENSDSEWFRENANFVAVENSEYDVKPLMPKRLPGGMINPAYLGESLIRSGANLVTQRTRKRNDQAVELAAQIYAHALARGGESGKKRVNADVPITIVTHGAGGATVDEALAILRSQNMKLPDSESGAEIIDRIQVIKLGSSNIGLADPPDRKKNPISMRTFTSSNDPYSVLPKTNETWKSEVPGGDVEDYMKTEAIRNEFLNAMGHNSTTYRSKKVASDTDAKKKARDERLGNLGNQRKRSGGGEGGDAGSTGGGSPPSPPAPGGSGGGSTPPAQPAPGGAGGQSSPPQSSGGGPAKKKPTTDPKPSSSQASDRTTAKKPAKPERTGVPTKEGFTWVKKEGHPEGGFFRKAKQKKADAFDWVLGILSGV